MAFQCHSVPIEIKSPFRRFDSIRLRSYSPDIDCHWVDWETQNMPEHFCNPGGVSGLELTGDKSRYVPRTDNVEVQNDSLIDMVRQKFDHRSEHDTTQPWNRTYV